MEPEIRADLPASSPIVAYGATRQPGGKKFLAILAGSFVLVLIGFFLWGAVAWQIPFPKNVIALAAVHGRTELPNGMPIVWQQATRAHHPVILGLTSSDAVLSPFAITLWSDETIGHVQTTAWPFVFSSDASLPLSETRPARDILGSIARLGSHSAHLSIDPRPLTSDAAQTMSGPLDGTTWHTDAEISGSNDSSLPPGDLSIDLDALPEAWPAIRDVITKSQPLLALDERPSSLGWTVMTESPIIIADYQTSPSTSTLLAYANAAGIFDTTTLTLPDGSTVDELGPPIQKLAASGTAAFESSSGTKLLVSGTTVVFGLPPGADNMTNMDCLTSPGIFAMSPKVLQPIFAPLKQGLRAFIEGGRLVFSTCNE